MTKEEARIIFESWQNYVEIADKFFRLLLHVPESFLPYPIDTLEEALNIIAKEYHDSGNERMVRNIKETMAAYIGPIYNEEGTRITDEEAITNMKKTLDLIEQDPELKKAVVKSLRECQESWIKSRSHDRR